METPEEFISNKVINHSHDYAVAALTARDAAIRQESKWISVKERLPEDLDCTLCVNRFGGMWVDQFYNGEWHDEQPTHWMPLPAPPVGKEGEE